MRRQGGKRLWGARFMRGEDIGQSQPYKNQICRTKMRGRTVRLEELVGIRTPNLVIEIAIS